jgi:Xaa-Pro aminopeptidase
MCHSNLTTVMSNTTELSRDSLFMVDSGGQYLDGTTDVTRTFHYGTPTQEQVILNN